jgi:hypothetical protein
MRNHGLTNFPDPTFGSGGTVGIQAGPARGLDPQSPAFQSAQKACQSVGGDFGFKTARPGG